MACEHFFHLRGTESMTCSINDIIHSSCNVEVAILIDKPSIACEIVARCASEVFIDKSFVVLIESGHERWRHWELNAHMSQRVRRKMMTILIDDSNSHSWSRLGRASRFNFECMQVHEVSSDRPASFSLPVIIIYQTGFWQTFNEPVAGWDIDSLSCHRKAGNIAQVCSLDVFAFGIFSPHSSHSSRRRIDTSNFIFLSCSPDDTSIREIRLSFEQDCSAAIQ
mmetsp:Transcript_45916/g.53102  ORF Transcript_45916/g.53102 Transcript_45916/m.53102 type:complete len:223 (+) Transcript_45916:102-770(+)